MSIAENIRLRRLELGLTQQELAEKLGYKTRSTVNKVEAGSNNVPEYKLFEYAKVLDTTVDYLKYGSNSAAIDVGITNRAKKTIAFILAGGNTINNQQNIPNQFVNVLGKPLIIFPLEVYQHHPAIDEIYVICLSGWESIVDAYAQQYHISKLKGIITAGLSGVLSVKNGVEAVKCNPDDILIFQESTRPLITEEVISKLIYACDSSVVVCEPMDDHVQFYNSKDGRKYLDRNRIVSLQSPEAYKYEVIQRVFDNARFKKHLMEETCIPLLMHGMGFDINFVEGNHYNIKVVRQEDIAILASLVRNKELYGDMSLW